jgi:hypothetical protein
MANLQPCPLGSFVPPGPLGRRSALTSRQCPHSKLAKGRFVLLRGSTELSSVRRGCRIFARIRSGEAQRRFGLAPWRNVYRGVCCTLGGRHLEFIGSRR